MTAVAGRKRTTARPAPPLRDGDRLGRAEFLRRWQGMPELRRAERIEGVVRTMPSPVAVRLHGNPDNLLGTLLGWYAMSTPGTLAYSNGTTFVDLDNDFQPDQALIVLPECGGQTRWEGDYLRGTPELVAEVASSSARRDRKRKLNVYRRAGTREYLLWRTRAPALEGFALDEQDGQYHPAAPSDGVWKSVAFPGLWIDVSALLAGDAAAARATSEAGLKAAEHARFAKLLASRR